MGVESGQWAATLFRCEGLWCYIVSADVLFGMLIDRLIMTCWSLTFCRGFKLLAGIKYHVTCVMVVVGRGIVVYHKTPRHVMIKRLTTLLYELLILGNRGSELKDNATESKNSADASRKIAEEIEVCLFRLRKWSKVSYTARNRHSMARMIGGPFNMVSHLDNSFYNTSEKKCKI